MKITVYRPMPFLTAAFLAGCVLAFSCKCLFQIHWILGCCIPVLLIGAGWLLRIRFSISVPIGFYAGKENGVSSEEKKKSWFLCCLYLMVFVGMIRCGAIYLKERKVSSQDTSVSGAICFVESKENASFGSSKYVISSRDFAGKAIVYLSEAMEIGDCFEADVKLNRIQNGGNPGEFDQCSYQRVRGIYFQGKAYHVQIQTKGRNAGFTEQIKKRILPVLNHLQSKLIVRLQTILPEKEAGFLAAMLLGDDSGLDSNLKTAFRSVGISHLLVISGLHLGILYSILQVLLSRLKNVRLQSDLMFLILGAYVFLTGAALSTLRAWIFCSVTSFQKRFSGKSDRINTLFFTALILLVWNPLHLLDTGFQLSFGCVLGISALKRWETLLLGVEKKPRKALFAMLSVNLISMPLSIWYFGVVSPYQFILNLILIPAMSILVPFAYMILLLSLVWIPGAMAGASVFSWMFFLLNQIVETVLTFPFAVLSIPRPPILFMILYGLLLVFLHSIAPKIQKRRIRRAISLCICVLMVCLWMIQPQIRVAFLNVGQGDCCIVEAEGTVWLIDAGPHYSKAIRPYLTYRGMTEIDGVLISHFDKDHIESLEQLMNDDRIRIRSLFLPFHEVHANEKSDKIIKKAEEKEIHIEYLKTGMEYSQGSLNWKCLSPDPQRDYPDENSASMVLLLEVAGKRFLFCGDADFYSEEIYSTLLQGSVDVIKAGHHGSSSSSSQVLLNRAQPQEAIISCQQENSYGHPHVQTLQRYEKIGTRLLITYEVGAIVYQKGLNGWSQHFGNSIF